LKSSFYRQNSYRDVVGLHGCVRPHPADRIIVIGHRMQSATGSITHSLASDRPTVHMT